MRETTPIHRGGVILLLFALCLATPAVPAAEAVAGGETPIVVPNPGSDLWRAVRQREGATAEMPGTSQVKGSDSGTLIDARGEQWRRYRMERLIPAAGWILGGVLIVLGLFRLVRGQVPIEGGRSARRILRYRMAERIAHWSMALLFLLLAATGLVMLFGRPLLLPLLGGESFGRLAALSKGTHDIAGPLFFVAMGWMFLRFVSRNLPEPGDLRWLLEGGGMVGDRHPSAGFFNTGEKIVFWLTVLGGTLMAVTGLLMLLPLLGADRFLLQLSHLLHSATAVVLMSAILGHIYIATLGMEGAMDAMKSGWADLNWARQHHDRWVEEVERHGGEIVEAEEIAGKAGQETSRDSPGATA